MTKKGIGEMAVFSDSGELFISFSDLRNWINEQRATINADSDWYEEDYIKGFKTALSLLEDDLLEKDITFNKKGEEY